MQSNVFTGRLADTPVLRGNGEDAVCRITLIDNEYAGKDVEGNAKERVVSIPFVIFGSRGDAIARHCRKGDQLIVYWELRNNTYTDTAGEKVYGYDFVVRDFEFGAPGAIKRAELAERQSAA